MTINYQEVKKIAVSFFSQIEQEMGISLSIVESHVRENDDGWFFPYGGNKEEGCFAKVSISLNNHY